MPQWQCVQTTLSQHSVTLLHHSDTVNKPHCHILVTLLCHCDSVCRPHCHSLSHHGVTPQWQCVQTSIKWGTRNTRLTGRVFKVWYILGSIHHHKNFQATRKDYAAIGCTKSPTQFSWAWHYMMLSPSLLFMTLSWHNHEMMACDQHTGRYASLRTFRHVQPMRSVVVKVCSIPEQGSFI